MYATSNFAVAEGRIERTSINAERKFLEKNAYYPYKSEANSTKNRHFYPIMR